MSGDKPGGGGCPIWFPPWRQISWAPRDRASLLQRWLLGTHQGAVTPEHLDAYLNEFTFRFNRRRSRRRGLLFYRLVEQAILAEPITYRSLIANPSPTGRRPTRATQPGRVATVAAVHRPWRQSPAILVSLSQIDSPFRSKRERGRR